MYLEVYTHVLNISLFNKGESIVVSPVPNGPHDVVIRVKLDKILINPNSSSLYLSRNLLKDKVRRWCIKRKAKKNVQSKRNN